MHQMGTEIFIHVFRIVLGLRNQHRSISLKSMVDEIALDIRYKALQVNAVKGNNHSSF
jgi:hypothetical protein